VLYQRPHGDGAVCYFTLGHCRGRFDMQDSGIADTGKVDRGPWMAPEFTTILQRCISWAITGPPRAPA
jgi:type 1 glutamine amidotransferase